MVVLLTKMQLAVVAGEQHLPLAATPAHQARATTVCMPQLPAAKPEGHLPDQQREPCQRHSQWVPAERTAKVLWLNCVCKIPTLKS